MRQDESSAFDSFVRTVLKALHALQTESMGSSQLPMTIANRGAVALARCLRRIEFRSPGRWALVASDRVRTRRRDDAGEKGLLESAESAGMCQSCTKTDL